VAWVPGDTANAISEVAKSKYRYDDPQGDDLFGDLEGNGLGFVNQVVTLVVEGRDTGLSEPEFGQYVFWDQVQPGQPAGTGVSTKNLINSLSSVEFGRWTKPKVVQFYLRFHR
jgi:hypothetical protein